MYTYGIQAIRILWYASCLLCCCRCCYNAARWMDEQFFLYIICIVNDVQQSSFVSTHTQNNIMLQQQASMQFIIWLIITQSIYYFILLWREAYQVPVLLFRIGTCLTNYYCFVVISKEGKYFIYCTFMVIQLIQVNCLFFVCYMYTTPRILNNRRH